LSSTPLHHEASKDRSASPRQPRPIAFFHRSAAGMSLLSFRIWSIQEQEDVYTHHWVVDWAPGWRDISEYLINLVLLNAMAISERFRDRAL